MSICHSGLKSKIASQRVMMDVSVNHPLIKLANALSWDELANIVMCDLQSTTKSKK
jgi:hypothetical protein